VSVAERPSALSSLSQSGQAVATCLKVLRLPSNCLELAANASVPLAADGGSSNVSRAVLGRALLEFVALPTLAPAFEETTHVRWAAEQDVMDSARFLQRHTMPDEIAQLFARLAALPGSNGGGGSNASVAALAARTNLTFLASLRSDIVSVLDRAESLLVFNDTARRDALAARSQLTPLLQCLSRIKSRTAVAHSSAVAAAVAIPASADEDDERRVLHNVQTATFQNVAKALLAHLKRVDAAMRAQRAGESQSVGGGGNNAVALPLASKLPAIKPASARTLVDAASAGDSRNSVSLGQSMLMLAAVLAAVSCTICVKASR
jgi:hypothetical protein